MSARYRFGHGIPQNCEAVTDARNSLTDPMLLAVARMVQAEECGMSREDGGIGHLWFAHTHFGICLENHATFLSLQEREH